MSPLIFQQKPEREPEFERYRDRWENALLAKLLSEQSSLEPDERRDLFKNWFQGIFNAVAAHALDPEASGVGEIEWKHAGPTQFDCVYTSPYGLKCVLSRVYEQPDGSWGALVIAGVTDDQWSAVASAEWAISRLCA